MYYQGRMYHVYRAQSHPVTYVFVYPDAGDIGKHVTFAYRRI